MTKPRRTLSAIDPYLELLPSPASPPSPADPTRGPHQLTVNVPQPESTTLRLGAGNPPGLRGESGTHVHLTAEKPLSTVSLGAAAGKGVAGFPDGIAMKTEGGLKLDVGRAARGEYHDTLTTTIAGAVNVECGKTQNIVVHGDSTDVRHKNQATTVGAEYSLTCQTSRVHVKGDHESHTDGSRKEIVGDEYGIVARDMRITSDRVKTTEKERHWFNYGTNISIFAGSRSEATLSLSIGVHALKAERTALNATKRQVSIERTIHRVQQIDFDNAKTRVAAKDVNVHLEKAGLWVLK